MRQCSIQIRKKQGLAVVYKYKSEQEKKSSSDIELFVHWHNTMYSQILLNIFPKKLIVAFVENIGSTPVGSGAMDFLSCFFFVMVF